MADTFVKNPVLLVGEKDEIVAQMGENDLGVATDVEFYTKQEVEDLVAQSSGKALPDQTENAGRFLITDGTEASWSKALKIKEDIIIGMNAAGNGASGTNAGISIGNGASSLGLSSIGIGSAAVGWGNRSVAIGYYARANATGSIQLGTTGGNTSSTRAVNDDADTLKVANHNGNFEMMDENGNVPLERLTYITDLLANIDYVVESQLPTAENNYTWYRKYKSGWIEQGGYDSASFSNKTWTYPVAMADTNYTLTLSVGYGNIGTQHGKFGLTARTETGFSYKVVSLDNNAVGDNMSWQVSGMAA